MLAALGPYRFAIDALPLGRLSRTSAPRAEMQGVIGGLPVRHVTGVEPTKLTLSATFYPVAMPGSGLAQLEAMARDARAATPLPFATADGAWRGHYVITSLTERREIIGADGRPARVVAEIELEEDAAPAGSGRLPGLMAGAD